MNSNSKEKKRTKEKNRLVCAQRNVRALLTRAIRVRKGTFKSLVWKLLLFFPFVTTAWLRVWEKKHTQRVRQMIGRIEQIEYEVC